MEVEERPSLLEYKTRLEDKIVSTEWTYLDAYEKGWVRGRLILINDILDGRFIEIEVEEE